ncbi:MAG: Tol-Pal system protein TolB, partial [Pseudomonadota bacterium]|nr:Tol-Pal system protein TolB [Pseudomonadota bacterium]
MKNIITILFILVLGYQSKLFGLNIDVTQGRIEPLPIAIVDFNYDYDNEQIFSTQINALVSKNLGNTGLFKILPETAFLQEKSEVFLQPLFSDWKLIDANFLITGKLQLENNLLKISFKLWDVYQEKIILNKNISGISISDWRISGHIISNLIYEGITGEKGYFDTKIVYVAEEGNDYNKIKRLALMDYDGNNHKFLT